MVNELLAAEDFGGRMFKFTVTAQPGSVVALAGSFNDWDPLQAPMADDEGNGLYSCTVTLDAGSYEYKFVVDEEWILDEENPNFASNDFGTLNSVLTVK